MAVLLTLEVYYRHLPLNQPDLGQMTKEDLKGAKGKEASEKLRDPFVQTSPRSTASEGDRLRFGATVFIF